MKTLQENLERATRIFNVRPEAELQAEARQEHERQMLGRLPEMAEHFGISSAELRATQVARKTAALQFAQAHAASSPRRPVLVLSGGVGCGKSVAAAFWLLQLARRPIVHLDAGRTWDWRRSPRFMPVSALQGAFGSFDKADRLRVAEAQKASALVLDDLGTEVRNVSADLVNLISERIRAGLPTCITTNGSQAEVAARYGARFDSRLAESGEWHACGSTDLRRLPLRVIEGGAS